MPYFIGYKICVRILKFKAKSPNATVFVASIYWKIRAGILRIKRAFQNLPYQPIFEVTGNAAIKNSPNR